MIATRLVRAAAATAAILLATACDPTQPDTAQLTSSAAPAPPATAYAPSWSAVHADAANTDYSPVEPADDLALAWERDLEGSISIGPLEWTINLGPTIDPGGRVYVTSTVPGCHLQALDATTGETLWCAPDIDLFAVMSSPLIDTDGNLYIADGKGMHGLDPTGAERWRTPLDGVPLSAQFTPDGHVVFVTHAGTVYVLDRATGAHVVDPVDLVDAPPWTPGTGLLACARGTEDCPSANTIAVDEATGRLFFTLWEPGATQAGLWAMTYTSTPEPTVTELWSVETLPGGSGSTPVVSADGRRVYVTDNVGSIHAIDAATGETAWTFPIGYAAGGSLSLSPEGLLMPAGGGGAGLIAVRDAGDEGVLAWRRDDLPNRGIATQTAGGKVFATVHVGGQRNDLVVLDTADGTILDREPIPGISVFSVGTTIGPDGTVYVPTIVGGLAAYRAPSFPQGPDPTEEMLLADGPFATATVAVPEGVEGFGGGVIHHPVVDDGTTFGAVALAPGFLGSSANYGWWGPRLASHGFVVLLMDTETRTDLPASRGSQLLAALDWLASSSPVAGMVDGERQAVVGHSLGGSGVLFAATNRPTLRAAVSLEPYHPRTEWPEVRVPTLVVGAELDTIAPPDQHAAPIYEGLTAAPEKAYVELAGAPHSVSTAGDDTQGLFVLAWLKRFVDGDLRYEPFLCPNPGPGGPLSDRRDTCPTGQGVEPAAAGTITGTVTAEGQPVEDVTVWAYRETDGWTGSGEATTGPDGRYRIDGLLAGDYRVRYGPPPGAGLAAAWYPGAATRGAATPLTIAAGPVAAVDADLHPAATVTGTVTGADGSPLPGVLVWAFAPEDLWVGTGLALTGPDGSYTMGGLLPGPYQLAFVPPADSGAPVEWHDDVPTRATATVLDLDPGVTDVGVTVVGS